MSEVDLIDAIAVSLFVKIIDDAIIKNKAIKELVVGCYNAARLFAEERVNIIEQWEKEAQEV